MHFIATNQLKIIDIYLLNYFLLSPVEEQEKKDFTTNYHVEFDLMPYERNQLTKDRLQATCTITGTAVNGKKLFAITVNSSYELKHLKAADVGEDFYKYLVQSSFHQAAAWMVVKNKGTWAQDIMLYNAPIEKIDLKKAANEIWHE